MNTSDEVGFSDEELFLFLLTVYRQDQSNEGISLWALAQQLEYSNADAQGLADILQRRGLLCFVSLSGNISLSSQGTFEVMLALSQPQKRGRHFPPITEFSVAGKRGCDVRYDYLSGLIRQLKAFYSELGPKEDPEDGLTALVEQLESKVHCGLEQEQQMVKELKALDRLLAARFHV